MPPPSSSIVFSEPYRRNAQAQFVLHQNLSLGTGTPRPLAQKKFRTTLQGAIRRSWFRVEFVPRRAAFRCRGFSCAVRRAAFPDRRVVLCSAAAALFLRRCRATPSYFRADGLDRPRCGQCPSGGLPFPVRVFALLLFAW